jgi:hypothetical protein
MSVIFQDEARREFIIPGPDDPLSGLQQIFGDEAQNVYEERQAHLIAACGVSPEVLAVSKSVDSAELARVHMAGMRQQLGRL